MSKLFTSKIFRKIVLIFILSEGLSFISTANPGDTTWVTVWNGRWLDHYGAYDTTAVFPTGKRYRKVRMHYLLGRYSCPGNPQYCGSWDYTTKIHACPAGKDSVEIARIITPYATDWLNLNKSHNYIIEVTDYASILDGSTALRFAYEGYSWGFTLTLKLEFIEGVPPMDALSIKNIYDGYYTYGAATTATNYIENKLVPKTLSYTAPTSKVFMKNFVSGHGSDATGCGEFCKKYYRLKVDNNVISQKDLWRANCGINHIYPQTGTWVYDRANWCPGDVVWPIYHNLSNHTTASNNFTVDVDMQAYTVSNPTGGFSWASQFIQYSSPNHTKDISIEDIIAPTKDANYKRNNNSCGNPLVNIKNVGTDSIHSIVFSYGIVGATPSTYTWTGKLGFLDTTLAVLPQAPSVLNNTLSNAVFSVNILDVNGAGLDQNVFNDRYSSQVTPVPTVPKDIIIKMATNNSTNPSTGFNQTTWTLYDENGSVVAFRDNCSNATAYDDTLRDLAPGCYKISIDDSGCDGISWWANTAGGAGTFRIARINGTNAMPNFNGDFGCNFTQQFKILAPPPTTFVAVEDLNGSSINTVDIYPNPVTNTAYVKFDLAKRQTVKLSVFDISGKLLYKKEIPNAGFNYEQIPVGQLNAGVYFVTTLMENGTQITKKMVIQH